MHADAWLDECCTLATMDRDQRHELVIYHVRSMASSARGIVGSEIRAQC
jgi:hypothetical protein